MRPYVNRTDSPSRTASLPRQRSRATGRTIWLSLGAIALVGGIASYGRALGVIQAADGKSILAWFEAALADPTIAAASVNIVDAHRQGKKVPKLSILSIVVAAVVTLGANIVYGAPQPLPKWLVNVWPPVAFLLAFESLMSYLRRGHGTAAADDPATESHGIPCPHGVASDVDDAVRQAYEHERDCEGGKPTFVEFEARFGINRKRVAELVRQPAAGASQGHAPAAMNGSAPSA